MGEAQHAEDKEKDKWPVLQFAAESRDETHEEYCLNFLESLRRAPGRCQRVESPLTRLSRQEETERPARKQRSS